MSDFEMKCTDTVVPSATPVVSYPPPFDDLISYSLSSARSFLSRLTCFHLDTWLFQSIDHLVLILFQGDSHSFLPLDTFSFKDLTSAT